MRNRNDTYIELHVRDFSTHFVRSKWHVELCHLERSETESKGLFSFCHTKANASESKYLTIARFKISPLTLFGRNDTLSCVTLSGVKRSRKVSLKINTTNTLLKTQINLSTQKNNLKLKVVFAFFKQQELVGQQG